MLEPKLLHDDVRLIRSFVLDKVQMKWHVIYGKRFVVCQPGSMHAYDLSSLLVALGGEEGLGINDPFLDVIVYGGKDFTRESIGSRIVVPSVALVSEAEIKLVIDGLYFFLKGLK